MGTSLRANNLIKRKRVTIPALSTIDVETIPFSSYSTTKYFIEYKSDANIVFKALEMYATKKGSDVTDTIDSKIGNSIDIETNVLKVATDVIFRVTNNESFDVVMSFSKMPL